MVLDSNGRKKTALKGCSFLTVVRTERLELSHLAAPEPKSGASTNFATSAKKINYTGFRWVCQDLLWGSWALAIEKYEICLINKPILVDRKK